MLKKAKFLSMVAVGTLAILPMGVNTAQAYDFTSPGVYLCRDANYGGDCYGYGIGDHIQVKTGDNDEYSSIKIVGNYEVWLYKDTGFGGGRERFLWDDSDLANNWIGNDSVSSLKVFASTAAAKEGVHFYEDANLTGNNWYSAKAETRTLAPNNNTLSSIRIEGRYTVTIYENENLGGRSLTFSGPGTYIWDLVPYGFNDTMSSYVVTTY